MKRILLLTIIFLGSIMIAYTQEFKDWTGTEENLKDTMNIGVGRIPHWVKNITTPEQYKIMEKYSKHYRKIDYRGLRLYHRDSTSMTNLFERMEKSCIEWKDEKKEEIEDWSFSSWNAGTISAYSKEILDCRREKAIIYSSYDGCDAHVEVEFIYYVDTMTGKPRIIQASVRGKSFSGLKVEAKPVPEMPDQLFPPFSFNYYENQKYFKGNWHGELIFMDAFGYKHQENVSTNFEIPLE